MQKPSKKLIDQWYNKLAREGFKDIEERHSPREMLKRWDSQYFLTRARSLGELRQEAKADYYLLAYQYLNHAIFASKRAERIWTMHSEGCSGLEIAKKLHLRPPQVYEIVKEIERDMYVWASGQRSDS